MSLQRQFSYSASLIPAGGPPLELKNGETWIGRKSFKAATTSKRQCSRRQACVKLTELGVHLECRGRNPIVFVVCQSKNLHCTAATPATELFRLPKGEVVELADGDQFYFPTMEYLLTVDIRIVLPKRTKEVLSINTVHGVLEDATCQQLIIDGEGPWRLSANKDDQPMETSPCLKDIGHGPEVDEDLPREACAPNDPIQTEPGCYPVTSSKTRDGQSIEDEFLPIVNEFVSNLRGRSSKHRTVDLGQVNNGTLPQSLSVVFQPVKDGRPEEMEVEEHPEGANKADKRKDAFIEASRGEFPSNPRDCLSERQNVDLGQAINGALPRSPVTGVWDGILVRIEAEDSKVADRVDERDGDPRVFIDEEDIAWPYGPVEGMELVIACVSGYIDVDKQNLLKLIKKTGAAISGSLYKATTHLVCGQFNSNSVERARKMHKMVVNHQWFEDCLRAGKRLSESPYKMHSEKDVRQLKWKDTPPPPVTERAEPSHGAINQPLIGHGASLSVDAEVKNAIDDDFSQQEQFQVNMGQQRQHAVCPNASDEKDLPNTSGQAGLPNVEFGHTERRKSLRLLERSGVEVGIETLPAAQENRQGNQEENLVAENPTAAPPIGTVRSEESNQNGELREFEDALEERNKKRRRKSESFDAAGQEHGHDTKRRKRSARLADICINKALSRSKRGMRRRGNPAVPGNQVSLIILADDEDDKDALQKPQLVSAQATERTNADDINGGMSTHSSQFLQRDREVACAICLVEAQSHSEGLLTCEHKFCYKCIFAWTQQAVNGPSCPLCKAPCDFITRREVNALEGVVETVVPVDTAIRSRQRPNGLDTICIQCSNTDSEDLMVRCGTCWIRAIHSFCMDPPVPPPWYCPGCVHGQRGRVTAAYRSI